MKILYGFFIRFYWLSAGLVTPFSKKANLWVKGRKNWKKDLYAFTERNKKKTIWVHASSLGEFEQARPIIEQIKENYPRFAIVCTFFSPSGYEVRKNYPLADWISYIPLDTKENASFWINQLNPFLAIFIKYDVWPNMVNTLYQKNIHFILACASFRKNQFYFQFYGGWFLQILKKFSFIFLANHSSYSLLNQQNISQIKTVGDTRFDRVVENAKKPQRFKEIETFIKANKTLVCGSTWQADEKLIKHLLDSGMLEDWKIIIAPHEVDKEHIYELKNLLAFNAITYSELIEEPRESQILIIDKIGILASVYQYADIAYIGGGFGAGIHNIIEPAVFGSPVIFGPNYHKFTEANEMVEQKLAFSIKTGKQLVKVFKKLKQHDLSTKIMNYVINKTGATDEIMKYIVEICDEVNFNGYSKVQRFKKENA